MEQPDINKDLLIKLRREGAVRVCEKVGVDALIGTQHDNVQYFTDLRRFFVYGWEPNAVAVISKEGATKLLDCGAHVAPGPHWANDGALLKEQTGWNHFSIFNSSLIPQAYAEWTRTALAELGVRKGKVGVDRVSWIILKAFEEAMPDITFVAAEEALLLERAVKNEEEQELMRYAGWIASEGVRAGLEAIVPGTTEYEVYAAFMGKLYELGSEGD
ncbi:MAG: aminopeptidase P family N-terminal domain-containing protein, partial [Gaiellaceae bacterium]